MVRRQFSVMIPLGLYKKGSIWDGELDSESCQSVDAGGLNARSDSFVVRFNGGWVHLRTKLLPLDRIRYTLSPTKIRDTCNGI